MSTPWTLALVVALSWANVVIAAAPFFGYGYHVLLGKSSTDTTGRNGVTVVQSALTPIQGPFGLKGYQFQGKSNSFARAVNNGKLNLGKKSWAIGTFFRMDGGVRAGPIAEWKGAKGMGAHYWIWPNRYYMNPVAAGSPTYSWKAPAINAWVFIGASYNYATGQFCMWENDQVYLVNAGRRTWDQVNDLYIGLRPAGATFHPLKAKMAGMTLLKGAVTTKAQVTTFKNDIIKLLGTGAKQAAAAAPVAGDCTFKLEGYGYTGANVLKNLGYSTEQVCLYECSILKGCAGATFRTTDGYCFFKKASCGAAQGVTMQNTANVAYRHWNKLQNGRSSTAVCPWKDNAPSCRFTKEGGLCNGYDLSSNRPTTTEKGCEMLCSADARCASFWYYVAAKKCYLKYRACTSAQLIYKHAPQTYNSYTKDASCAMPNVDCDYDKVNAQCSRASRFLLLKVIGYDTCEDECSVRRNCVGFFYDQNSEQCHLQSTIACTAAQLINKGTTGYTQATKKPGTCRSNNRANRQSGCAYGKPTFGAYNQDKIGGQQLYSFDACQSWCSKNTACKSFFFTTADCRLFDRVPMESKITSKGDLRYRIYVKTGVCPKVEMMKTQLKLGTCPSQILYWAGITLRACDVECAVNPNCRSYNFYSNKCYIFNYQCTDKQLRSGTGELAGLYKYVLKQNDGSLSKYQSTDTYIEQDGHCSDSWLATYANMYEETCKRLCSDRLDCNGFSRNSANRYCYLSSKICTGTQITHKKTTWTYYTKRDKLKIKNAWKCDYKKTQGQCPHSPYISYDGADLDTCKSSCDNFEDCLGFYYYDRQCKLQNRVCTTTKLKRVGDPTITQYTKQSFDTCQTRAEPDNCKYDLQLGFCPGWYLKPQFGSGTISNMDINACKKACSDDGACQGFNYYEPLKCVLLIGKCQTAELTSAGNLRRMYFTKKANCRKVEALASTQVFGDCNGHDYRAFSTITYEGCQTECTRRQDCVNFHFQKLTCWLKRHTCTATELRYTDRQLYKQTRRQNEGVQPVYGQTGFTFQKGYCPPNYRIRYWHWLSLDACKTECFNEIDCRSFKYNPASQTCDLQYKACATKDLKYPEKSWMYNQYLKTPYHALPTSRVCSYKHVNAYGYNGGYIVRNINDLSLETCMAECDNNVDCAAFQFNSRLCYLQNTVTIDSKLTKKGEAGNNYYIKTNTQPCPIRRRAAVCDFERQEDFYCNNHYSPAAVPTVSSIWSCMVECSQTRSCKGFIFNRNRCWFQDKVCAEKELTKNTDVWRHQFTKKAGGACPRDIPGKFTVGEIFGNCNHALRNFACKTLESCKTACYKTSWCLGFLLYNNNCYLRKHRCTKSQLVNQNDVRFQWFERDGPGTEPNDYVNTFRFEPGYNAGGVTGTFTVTSFETCKSLCTDKLDCFAFNYNSVSRICYTKYIVYPAAKLAHQTLPWTYAQYVKTPIYAPRTGRQCEYTVRNAICAPGATYVARMSEDSCKAECDNDLTCLAFTNYQSGCYIHRTACNENQFSNKGNTEYNMYTKKDGRNCPIKAVKVCQFDHATGKCTGHVYNQINYISELACKVECSRFRVCKGYYYYNRLCYLQDAVCDPKEFVAMTDLRHHQFTKKGACPEAKICEYSEAYGYFGSFSIGTISSMTFESCRAQASLRPSCVTFRYQGNKCILQTVQRQKDKLTVAGNRLYRQYYKDDINCNVPQPEQTCDYEKRDGYCRLGGQFKSYSIIELEACKRQCDDEFYCAAFWYNARDLKCYLFKIDKVCAPKDLTNKEMPWIYNQYVKSPSCPRKKVGMCRFSQFNGHCGGTIKHFKSTLEACKVECSFWGDCINIHYSSGTCYLQNTDCIESKSTAAYRGKPGFLQLTRLSSVCNGMVPESTCKYDMTFGICQKYALATIATIHIDTCLTECSTRADCWGFNYYSGNCYMLKGYCTQAERTKSYEGKQLYRVYYKKDECMPRPSCPNPAERYNRETKRCEYRCLPRSKVWDNEAKKCVDRCKGDEVWDNRLVKCASTRVCRCTTYGASHFNTYDGQLINFGGQCSYTLSKLKADQSDNKCYFDAKVKYIKISNKVVRTVQLTIGEFAIQLRPDRKVRVNRIDYEVPFYLKTKADVAVNVEIKGELTEIAVPACDILVTYESKAFGTENYASYIVVGGDRYGGKMVGLCGDCDGEKDDYRSSDGTLVEGSNRDSVIGSSWTDSDEEDDEEMPDSCDPPTKRPCSTANLRNMKQNSYCNFLLDVNGPFGPCIKSGLVPNQNFYESCEMDICDSNNEKYSKCRIITAFAQECAEQGFIAQSNWRSAYFCPSTCPSASVYKQNMFPCQQACQDRKINNCNMDRVEGCECNIASYRQFWTGCPSKSYCGCFKDGRTYKHGVWVVLEGCDKKRYCSGTKLTDAAATKCDAKAKCLKQAGQYKCVCNFGYRQSGTRCYLRCTNPQQAWDGKICVNRCSDGLHWDTDNEICTDPCPAFEERWDARTKKCVQRCKPADTWDGSKCNARCQKPLIWNVDFKKCVTKICRCDGIGDPHYRNYDGRAFNYQGHCKYTYTKIKDQFKKDTCYFNVEEKNVGGGATLVRLVDVEIQDVKIRIKYKGILQVNGINQANNVPLTVKAKGGNIVITRKNDGFIVSAGYCGIVVEFWLYVLKTYITSDLGSKVEGLCGTCNGNGADDFRPKEGSKDKNFWTSFSVPDDSGMHYQASCKSPDVNGDCTNTWAAKVKTDAYCGKITNANGVFKKCIASGLVETKTAFDDCSYDVCIYSRATDWNTQTKKMACANVESFAEKCAKNGFGASWRSSSFCPLTCGDNEVFSGKMYPGCEATCKTRRAPAQCDALPQQGCVCRGGYLRLGDKCMHPNHCGCYLKDGSHVNLYEKRTTDDCSAIEQCRTNGNMLVVSRTPCHREATCQSVDGERKCVCNFGYTGDGRNCQSKCRSVAQRWTGEKCVDRCPPEDLWDNNKKICKPRCQESQQWNMQLRRCVDRCKPSDKWEKGACEPRCTKPKSWDIRIKRCTERICTCKAWGDPHYHRFDDFRRMINFMGICKYLFSGTTNMNDKCSFRIEVKNEHRGNTRVSFGRMMDLKMGGYVIRLHKTGWCRVNGLRMNLPFSLSLPGGHTLSATKSGANNFKITVATCSFVMTFGGPWGSIVTSLGHWQYGGPGRLTGICGDCDGKADALNSLNNYQVGDDSDTPNRNCKPVEEPKIECTSKDNAMIANNEHCGYIKSKTGPFADCIKSGEVNFQSAYDACQVDVCAFKDDPNGVKKVVCAAVGDFAKECQLHGYQPSKVWRTTKFCPFNCPANSVYNMKMRPCQPNCKAPQPVFCDEEFAEGCKCKSGFILDGDNCVSERSCGCWDNEKNYYTVGETRTKSDCTIIYKCVKQGNVARIVESQLTPCHTNAECKPGDEGINKCQCKKGYEGNGFNCKPGPELSCKKDVEKWDPEKKKCVPLVVCKDDEKLEGGKCIKLCADPATVWNKATEKCDQRCTDPQTQWNVQEKKCKLRCTADKVWAGDECVDKCTGDQVYDAANNKCKNRCNDPTPVYNFEKKACEKRCDPGLKLEKDKCIPICKNTEKWNVNTMKCEPSQTVCQCFAWGKNLFYSHDGQWINYPGKCVHTIAKLDSKYRNDKCYFEINTKNLPTEGNRPAGKLIQVIAGFYKISIFPGGEVRVDGITKSIPFKLTAKSKGATRTIDVYRCAGSGDYRVVDRECGLFVAYDGKYRFFTDLTPFAGKLSGICGDCDGKADDYVTSEGIDVSHKAEKSILVGDSYVIADHTGTPVSTDCVTEPPEQDHECETDWYKKIQTEEYCGKISETTGPFAKCLKSGKVPYKAEKKTCIDTLCENEGNTEEAGKLNCDTMKALAAACATHGFVVLYRTKTFCPINCEQNSFFNPSMAVIQPSCKQPKPPQVDAGSQPMQGCQCNAGFFRKGDTCVKASDCGCTTDDGRVIKVKEEVMREGCQMKDVCDTTGWGWPILAGKENNPGCDSNAECVADDGDFKCGCKRGYEGDGYTCKSKCEENQRWSSRGCVEQCAEDQKWNDEKEKCDPICKETEQYDPRTKKCGKKCKPEEELRNGNCVPRCAKDKVWNVDLQKCLSKDCQCKTWGDPHYVGMDGGNRVDFQGVCMYTLSKLTDQTNKCAFHLKNKNEVRNKVYAFSFTRLVDLTMGDTTFRLQIRKGAFINGIAVNLPMRYKLKNGVVAELSVDANSILHVKVPECEIALSFGGVQDYAYFTVSGEKYGGKMTGICGNCDGVADDKYDANDFAVPDTSDAPEPTCKKGSDKPAACTDAVKRTASTDQFCGYITNTNGPFGACIRSGKVDTKKLMDACLFDVCAYHDDKDAVAKLVCEDIGTMSATCNTFGYYATWRRDNFCSLGCDANSDYKIMMRPCQPSCAQPNPKVCPDAAPIEGCQCKPGFIKSGNTCVKQDDCGCLDKKTGQYFKLNEKATATDCKSAVTCVKQEGEPAMLVTSYPKCDENSECTALSNGKRGCKCKEGYYGDPASCTKIIPVPKTTSGTGNGAPCQFPYYISGKAYYTCTEDGSAGKPWCSVTTYYDTDKMYGYCPKPCKFPFTYKGKQYTDCIADGAKFWCSTTSVYNGDYIYCEKTIECTSQDGGKKQPGDRWSSASKNYFCDETGTVKPIPQDFPKTGCVFPFNYNGKYYGQCIGAKKWCSKTNDMSKDNSWDYCPESCVFPFTYQGKQHSDCIADSSGKFWCGTTSNYDTDKKFMYCPARTACKDQNGGERNPGERWAFENKNYFCSKIFVVQPIPIDYPLDGCVFPFISGGKYKGECQGSKPWCATTSNYDTASGKWVYCSPPCTTQTNTKVGAGTKWTHGGKEYYCKDDGKYSEFSTDGECVFPFKYNNAWYDKCTGGSPWCSKDHIYTSNYKYC